MAWDGKHAQFKLNSHPNIFRNLHFGQLDDFMKFGYIGTGLLGSGDAPAIMIRPKDTIISGVN